MILTRNTASTQTLVPSSQAYPRSRGRSPRLPLTPALDLEGALGRKVSLRHPHQARGRQVLGEGVAAERNSGGQQRVRIEDRKTSPVRQNEKEEEEKIPAGDEYRLNRIDQVLRDLLSTADGDIEALPVGVKLDCGEEEDRIWAEGGRDRVCVNDLALLREIEDLSSGSFEEVTLLNLKVALVKDLINTMRALMLESELKEKGRLDGDPQARPQQVPQSVEIMERVYDSHLKSLVEKLAQLESRGDRSTARDRFLVFSDDSGKLKGREGEEGWEDREGEEEKAGKWKDGNIVVHGADEDVGDHNEQQSNDEVGEEEGVVMDVDTGRSVNEELAELEENLPPMVDEEEGLSNPDDAKDYEMEGGNEAGPPGHDYDMVAAKKGNRIESHRNSREDPFSPPSNFVGGAKNGGQNFKEARNQAVAPVPSSNKALNKPIAAQKKHPVSQSLYKLVGYHRFQFTSLEERGFADQYSFESRDLITRRKKYIHGDMARKLTQSRRHLSVNSVSPNLLHRAKFQRYQTDQFCGQNRISKGLPSKYGQLESLFKHLLYDDRRKIVVCYVPKNGCSNLKRMMLILNGLLPPDANLNPYNRPSEDLLGSVNSFRNLTREEAIYKLENYYKFAIVRNPMERLLSAYKNKLEKPLNATLRRKFPDRLKAYILNLYDHKRLKNWIGARDYSIDIHPTFSQFLKFMTQFLLSSYNEHFMPFLQLCFPCAIDYDVVLNFKSLNYDMFALMEYLGIRPSYYPAAISHESDPTSVHLKQYYRRVSSHIKGDIFHKLQQELDYYYAMHPEEEGMHKHL